MGVMDLDCIKPSLQGSLDGGNEVGLELVNLLQAHGARHGMIIVPGDGRGADAIIGPAVEIFASYGAATEPWSYSRCFTSLYVQRDQAGSCSSGFESEQIRISWPSSRFDYLSTIQLSSGVILPLA